MAEERSDFGFSDQDGNPGDAPMPQEPAVYVSAPKNTHSKLRAALVLVLVLALVFGVSVGVNFWLSPTPDELRSTVFDDGEFEGLNVEGDMTQYTRRVRFDMHRFYTIEEIKSYVFGRSGYDQLDEEAKAEFEETLDKEIATLPVNSEGLVSQNDLPSAFRYSPTELTGVLIGDHVVIPTQTIGGVFNVSRSAGERISITISLLADPRVEDEWMKEELFQGSVLTLSESSSVTFDNDHALAYLARPDTKVLVDPGESPYESAALNDVGTLNTAVYPRFVSGNNVTDSGAVAGVVNDTDFFLVQGHHSRADLGAPVFLVKDNELVWVGIFVGSTNEGQMIVVSAEAVQKRLR